MTVNDTSAFGVQVNEANPMLSRFDGQSPVMQVVLDMLKRGVLVAPFLIAGGYAIWGSQGAWSVAFGLAHWLAGPGLASCFAWASSLPPCLCFAMPAGSI